MKTKGSAFRELHHSEDLLILANVADAGSARVVQGLGSKAIATSSAAVAWSHGYQDGNQLPLELLITTIKSMVRVLEVPLTVDIEGGYSDDLETIPQVIGAVINAGAVGINIEDGASSTELLCQKIEVARAAANKRDVDLFINARTDVYLKSLVSPGEMLEETIKRASLYAEAGADGLFAAGMVAESEIAELCQSTRLPVNLLYREGMLGVEELKRLGVKRLSAGSRIAELMYGANATLAKEFLQAGHIDTWPLNVSTYGELNALMEEKQQSR